MHVFLSSPLPSPFPLAVSVLIWYTAAHCDGSFLQLYQHFADSETNFFQTLFDLWPNPFDPVAVKIFTVFVVIQLAFMRLLPGEYKEGPVTPAGNIPVYKANGDLTYWISKLGYIALLMTGVIPLGLVWDNLGNLFALCNLFSIVFVFFLTIKGRMAPCTSDSGSSGNFMFDYYVSPIRPSIFLAFRPCMDEMSSSLSLIPVCLFSLSFVCVYGGDRALVVSGGRSSTHGSLVGM